MVSVKLAFRGTSCGMNSCVEPLRSSRESVKLEFNKIWHGAISHSPLKLRMSSRENFSSTIRETSSRMSLVEPPRSNRCCAPHTLAIDKGTIVVPESDSQRSSREAVKLAFMEIADRMIVRVGPLKNSREGASQKIGETSSRVIRLTEPGSIIAPKNFNSAASEESGRAVSNMFNRVEPRLVMTFPSCDFGLNTSVRSNHQQQQRGPHRGEHDANAKNANRWRCFVTPSPPPA